MQSKIGIIGLGAIGSVIAKALISNDNNLIKYYTRTPKSEIKIEFESRQELTPIVCETRPGAEENFDWVIVCLKAYHFKSATTLFKSLIGPKTKVAIIRNGLDLTEDMLPFTKREHILPCIIDCSVQLLSNGFYWQLNKPTITSIASALSLEFSTLFPSEYIIMNQTDDFKTQSWKKLIESSSIGALQCITGQTCHIFHDSNTLNLFKQLVREGIIVAIADGAKLELSYVDYLVAKILQYPKGKGSSMLTDRLAGRQIELAAKNGAISKKAKSLGIPAPLNDLYSFLIAKPY